MENDTLGAVLGSTQLTHEVLNQNRAASESKLPKSINYRLRPGNPHPNGYDLFIVAFAGLVAGMTRCAAAVAWRFIPIVAVPIIAIAVSRRITALAWGITTLAGCITTLAGGITALTGGFTALAWG